VLYSTLDIMLIEDSANELDSNSDDDIVSDDEPNIDPNPDILAFVELARLQSKGKLSRETYEQLRHILRALKVELPSLRRSESKLRQLTKIHPKLVDCCANSCLAYTGTFEQVRICPHCNESRYSASGKPRKQFLYVPIADRLVLQYRDASRARILKSYRQMYSNPSEDSDGHKLRDVFDGALYQEYHLRELKTFRDPHDIALHLSLDGVQLTNIKNHEVRMCKLPHIKHACIATLPD